MQEIISLFKLNYEILKLKIFKKFKMSWIWINLFLEISDRRCALVHGDIYI